MSDVLVYQLPEGLAETRVDIGAVRRSYPPAAYLTDEQILLMIGADVVPPGIPFWIADLEKLAQAYEELGDYRDSWKLDIDSLGEPLGYGVEAPTPVQPEEGV